MPNHVTNWVSIRSDDPVKLAELRRLLRTPEEELDFDANNLIPMPPELRETTSPPQIVATQEEADKINAAWERLDVGKVKAITQEEADRRMVKYGARDWYDWARQNWGTKWGAYDVELLKESEDQLFYQFHTAWSPPTPVYEKLTEMGFTVDVFWQDEDPNNEGSYGDPEEVFYIDRTVTVTLR